MTRVLFLYSSVCHLHSRVDEMMEDYVVNESGEVRLCSAMVFAGSVGVGFGKMMVRLHGI